MIKLGDGYYDEASIISITPSRNPRASNSQVDLYTVHTVTGHSFRWDADAAEVQRRLEEVGLITQRSIPVPGFTEHELAELGEQLENGYNYAAKDEDGRVYAYEMAPAKGVCSWINNDSVSGTIRLIAGQYVALSFEDECPLDIAVALEGVQRC